MSSTALIDSTDAENIPAAALKQLELSFAAKLKELGDQIAALQDERHQSYSCSIISELGRLFEQYTVYYTVDSTTESLRSLVDRSHCWRNAQWEGFQHIAQHFPNNEYYDLVDVVERFKRLSRGGTCIRDDLPFDKYREHLAVAIECNPGVLDAQDGEAILSAIEHLIGENPFRRLEEMTTCDRKRLNFDTDLPDMLY